MDIRHNRETASRSSQQPLAFSSNIFRGYMLPSMEGSNLLYFVQLGDERRTLSLLLRITDFIHFMNYFFFKVYSFLVWIPPSPITVLKIKMGKINSQNQKWILIQYSASLLNSFFWSYDLTLCQLQKLMSAVSCLIGKTL